MAAGIHSARSLRVMRPSGMPTRCRARRAVSAQPDVQRSICTRVDYNRPSFGRFAASASNSAKVICMTVTASLTPPISVSSNATPMVRAVADSSSSPAYTVATSSTAAVSVSKSLARRALSRPPSS